MFKLAIFALCITTAAACTKDQSKSKLDELAGARSGGPTSAGGGTAEQQIERLARKLDKVATALDTALGPNTPDPATTYSVAISPNDPIEGPVDAKVTIVEAFEFMCPYCYMVNPLIEQIMQKYPNDVRVVSKYVVIHGQPAKQAAQIACAAHKQGKYPAVKTALWNTLFKNEGGRPQMQQAAANLDAMKAAAVAAGADGAKLDADMVACGDEWLRSSDKTLKPVGVRATPSFFVNGRFVQAQGIEAFDEVIKVELAKADKAIADGVKQGAYYDDVVVAKGEKTVKARFDE